MVGDLIIAPSRQRPLLVLKPGGRGDVSESHVLWSFQSGPDVPTPVSDGKYLYVVDDRGIMWCLEAKTGREIYGQQRLRPGTYSGSPVLADGKIYVTNEDGLTSVVKAGPKFELLAENDFGGLHAQFPGRLPGTDFHPNCGTSLGDWRAEEVGGKPEGCVTDSWLRLRGGWWVSLLRAALEDA